MGGGQHRGVVVVIVGVIAGVVVGVSATLRRRVVVVVGVVVIVGAIRQGTVDVVGGLGTRGVSVVRPGNTVSTHAY